MVNPYLEGRELTKEEIVEEYKRIKKELSEKDKRIKEMNDLLLRLLNNSDDSYTIDQIKINRSLLNKNKWFNQKQKAQRLM